MRRECERGERERRGEGEGRRGESAGRGEGEVSEVRGECGRGARGAGSEKTWSRE